MLFNLSDPTKHEQVCQVFKNPQYNNAHGAHSTRFDISIL